MLVTRHLSHAHSSLQQECNIRLNLKTRNVYKQYNNYCKQKQPLVAGPAQTAIKHDSIAWNMHLDHSQEEFFKFIFKSLYMFVLSIIKNINFTERK